jgi:uncharacterized protein (TIGR02001 family)
MKKTLLSLSIAAAAVSVPTQAADIGGGLDLSGNMSLTSSYYWRGMDQNSDSPAVQGGLDLAHESGVYVGVWASNASAAADANTYSAEVDLYGGYATEMAGIGLDVGYVAYMYPGSTDGTNFEEMYLGVSKEFGGVELGVTQYWGTSDAPDNLEFSAGTELAGFGLSATYGDYDGASYGEYYSVGISKEILSEKWPVEVSLTYTEMDYDAAGSTDEDQVIFAVSKSF